MLKRKILNELVQWKSNKNKKVLMIEGMRQTGKTFIVNYFANQYFHQYININFLINPKYKAIFDSDLDIESVKQKMKMFNEFSNIEFNNKLLIFLDEIQECPNAIVALKALSQDNNLNVIASGSYLGIKYKELSSYPIGYVKTLKMYPLDFEEFMWALNVSDKIINEMKSCFDNKQPIDQIIHQQAIEWFKQYMIVGGMPEVVNNFIQERNFYKIRDLQKEIINMFFIDAMKYANVTERQKIIECFNSIPQQLAKENKKFMFSKIKTNARSKWYYSSLSWLVDSNIVNKCQLVNKLENPLNAYEINDNFKIYLSDTGLLISLLDDVIVEQIMDNKDFIYKGALYENLIAQILSTNNYKLRYFTRNHTLELDFIISKPNGIHVLEIKSGNNYSKSLNTILNENQNLIGIEFSNNNISLKQNKLILPFYLSFLF